MNIKCLRCKGRGHCNRPVCPLTVKISSQKTFSQNAKQDYFGETPNMFVGRYGYPNINVGFLNVEEYQEHDEPLLWAREDYGIDKIIDLRSSLVNSNFNTHIKSFNDKLVEMGQEVSMAAKPVDMEINLEKKPSSSMSYNQDITPHGPSVKLKKAQLTENPKIPTKVDKVVSDTDLKANGALKILSKKGLDEHYLTKLLSVGNLGVKIQRKLVPTRWSITAVDDNVCKHKLERVKQHQHSDFKVYFGGHLGNYYLILFFPGEWSYELFETYVSKPTNPWSQKGAVFATDYENYNGRKQYAHETAGGYYAARLAVVEGMEKIKRQASCLCLRFITDDYWAPLGVWVVREATRNAMKSKPLEFASKELMLKYAEALVQKKFGFNLNNILGSSKLLHEIKHQKRLFEYT